MLYAGNVDLQDEQDYVHEYDHYEEYNNSN